MSSFAAMSGELAAAAESASAMDAPAYPDEYKKRRLSGDERLSRNRERNRIHARRTRERKRSQTLALQSRIKDLHEEGLKLRQMIDETYTASSLLGLAHHHTGGAEAAEAAEALYVPSSTVCKNIYAEVFPSESSGRDPLGPECSSPVSSKRVRRSGKYSQQERDRIRRERNRMHAKKTRDRKKQFLEISEKVISEMEAEALAMRHYLRSLNLISEQEMAEYIERDNRSKRAIEQMKLESAGAPDDDEDEDDEDDDVSVSSEPIPGQGFSADKESRSQSSGDDNEKTSSCGDFTSNGSSSRMTASSGGFSHSGFPSANLATLEYKGGVEDKAGTANSSGSEDQEQESPCSDRNAEWPGGDFRLGSLSEAPGRQS